MRSEGNLRGCGILVLPRAPHSGHEVSALPLQANVECAVTTPNGIAAGEDHPDRGSYGNAQVSVGPFGLWPDGTVVFKPGGAGFITRDGSLGISLGGAAVFPGELKIEGRRVDALAPQLRSEVSSGYG